MGALEKYKLTKKPPKVRRIGPKATPISGIRKKFIAGAEKQKAQAKAWQPGAKDLRSWVTRDEDRGLAWVTVKYGARPVPVKGTTRTTIGPVRLNEVPKVFDDIKQAAQAGELDKGLQKVAIQGPRKKKRAKTA
jgi:hypothetical protein